MTLQIGDQAPDFTLYNTHKEPVTLSAQGGKRTVLLFFPLAFTGVCTKELCQMRDDLHQYNDLNAQVFGISVDSVYTLKAYSEQQDLNFPLLSDFNKEVSKQYDSLYDEFSLGMKGVSKRSAFVLDENQRVIYAEVLENAGELPDFAKIKAVLQQLPSENSN